MLLLAGKADDSALAIALHLLLAEAHERKLGHAFAEFDAGIDHWPQILDVAPGVGILHHRDSGNASQPLLREASGLLEGSSTMTKLRRVRSFITRSLRGVSAILCIVSRSVNSVC